MPDYSKGKIYTIRCRNDDTLIYVGSTIQPLSKRFGGHKVASKKDVNRLIYSTINNDWDNWFVELYENYPCDNKEQLDKKEGEIIRQIGTLNKNVAGRKMKEYRQENADRIKEYKKEYRQANADMIKEKNKEYSQENADKIKEYNKEYREKNADMIKEKKKEYRENNADMIKEYRENNADRIREYNLQNAEKKKQYNKEYRQRKKLEKQAIPSQSQ